MASSGGDDGWQVSDPWAQGDSPFDDSPFDNGAERYGAGQRYSGSHGYQSYGDDYEFAGGVEGDRDAAHQYRATENYAAQDDVWSSGDFGSNSDAWGTAPGRARRAWTTTGSDSTHDTAGAGPEVARDTWNPDPQHSGNAWNTDPEYTRDTWNANSGYSRDTWNTDSDSGRDTAGAGPEVARDTWNPDPQHSGNAWNTDPEYTRDTWNANSGYSRVTWNTGSDSGRDTAGAGPEVARDTWNPEPQDSGNAWNADPEYTREAWNTDSGYTGSGYSRDTSNTDTRDARNGDPENAYGGWSSAHGGGAVDGRSAVERVQIPAKSSDRSVRGKRRGGAHRLPAPPGALKGRAAVIAVAAGAIIAAGQNLATGSEKSPQTVELQAVGQQSAAEPVSIDLPAAPELLDTATPTDLGQYGDVLENGSKFAEDLAAEAEAKFRPLFTKFASGSFTSGYGERWGVLHPGVDVAAPIGTPIYAVEDGTVIDAGPAAGFGMWVRMRGDDGTITVYGHINTALVSVGQHVLAGDEIATVGNRGESTGPHCHFEVWLNGTDRIDPLPWLATRGISLGQERD
ncbi:M23 family metallopeptidase [Nocardia sp. NBC_00565]|uniref:M23 family metallopeptidase n=1 Tax=Nocardia sp. NBC_00565 TaxID=2975993 RepID=UPI003FA59E12